MLIIEMTCITRVLKYCKPQLKYPVNKIYNNEKTPRILTYLSLVLLL